MFSYVGKADRSHVRRTKKVKRLSSGTDRDSGADQRQLDQAEYIFPSCRSPIKSLQCVQY